MASRRRSPSFSPPSSPPLGKRSRFEKTDPSLDEFIEVIESGNRKFAGHPIHKSRNTYRIKKLPAHSEPEALIGGLFIDATARAIIDAKKYDIQADTASYMIFSENLEEGRPIFVPVRPLNEHIADYIYTTLMKVEQSRSPLGLSLFDADFDIEVTLYQKNGLAKKQKKIYGGAPPSRKTLKIQGETLRKLGGVTHHIAKRERFEVPNQRGNRCLFYALHVALKNQIGGMTWKQWERYLNGVDRGQPIHKDVENLMRTLNIPLNEKKYDAKKWVPAVVDYWNDVLHKDQYRIKVWFFPSRGLFQPMKQPEYKYGARDYNIELIIYWDGAHFTAVRSSGSLFGQRYCLECESCYEDDVTHRARCKKKCLNCGRVGAAYPCQPEPGVKIECLSCGKTFVSMECYAQHIKKNQANKKFCDRSKKCGTCGIIWDIITYKENGWLPHKCGETYCKRCNDLHETNNKRCCYIQPIEVKTKKPARIIAFDIETYEETVDIPPKKPNDLPKTQKKLVPNFIAARVACNECFNNGEWKLSKMSTPCSVCGPVRTITFGTHPYEKTYQDKAVVCDDPENPPITQFTQWLLNELPQKYDSYIFSQNGGRFDKHFVIVELYKQGWGPNLIRRGNKLITMDLEKDNKHKLKFRDSLNLLNMRLELLPSAFELDVADKGVFPHKLNRPENFGKRIIPTIDDYIAKGWSTEKYLKFKNPFDESNPFYLNEELPAYCINDVEILMGALHAFRQLFMDISKRNKVNEDGDADRAGHIKEPHNGLDPLTTASTIARACVNLFKANHLPTHHLALVPERGYDKYDNQSDTAYRYLRWLEEEEGVPIQTAYTEGGEKHFGDDKRVDGYYEKENEQGEIERVIIEVNGCPYHGCAKCFPNDHELIPKIGKTPAQLRKGDEIRNAYLRRCVDRLDIIWTCEIDKMLAKDPEMKKRFEQYKDRSPLDPRDAFFGGRTGPLSLFYEPGENEKISYYDFTSLYPYVNYMLEEWMMGYPVGHPEVYIKNETVNWTCAADNPYKIALLKCFVVPPRQIDIPILPLKLSKNGDERLLFPLCSKCAQKHEKGGFYEHYQCNHSDNERGWTGTFTSVELDAALNEGYQVKELVRVYEYDKGDRELFRGYMKEFLGLKIHASGFDKSIAGNFDAEEQFLRECEERFGIIIDRALMRTDKGKRAHAKLIVNNLWGRFGMKNWGLEKTEITDNPSRIGELLNDHKFELVRVEELIEGTEEKPSTIMIIYTTKKGLADENDASNVIISLWTTSCARVLLLRSMQKVVRTPGCKLHYVDTDSLIFSHPKNECPLELGPHIGDFTDELPDHDILEVTFGGPKQYGIKYRKKGQPDAPFEYMRKIRGITMNYDVERNQGFSYEKFKEFVLKYARTGTIDSINLLYPNALKIQLKKGATDGPIISTRLQKKYKPVVSKGIIKKGDFKIYNYGENF